MNKSGWIVLILFLLTILPSGCLSDPSANPAPPAYDPENPALAMVGTFAIDQNYFQVAVEVLPRLLKQSPPPPAAYRQYLDDLVVQEIYYQEGKRRKYNEKPDYLTMLAQGKKTGLVEFLVRRSARAFPPEDSRPESEKMEHAFFEMGQKLEQRFSVRFHLDTLAEATVRSTRPVVESGIMTWTYAEFLVKAADAGYRAELILPGTRERTLKRMVYERMIHDNAVADQVDKDAEFMTFAMMLEHFILSSYTKTTILGDDVEATLMEARAYYDLHPDQFFGLVPEPLPFEMVEKRAFDLATAQKRKKVLSDLSYAISGDRFRGVVFESHCQRAWGGQDR